MMQTLPHREKLPMSGDTGYVRFNCFENPLYFYSCAYSDSQSVPSSPFCPDILIIKVFAGK